MRAVSPNLQCVRRYFVRQANATPLLLQVDDEARAVLLNVPHGHLKLPRTVALQRPQHLCKMHTTLMYSADNHPMGI